MDDIVEIVDGLPQYVIPFDYVYLKKTLNQNHHWDAS